MNIVLTGDRPSGKLHLGHYVGSLKTRIEMQNKCKIYILIADMQAMTDYFSNSQVIKNNILDVLEDYLACGIDPELSCIFLQSCVSSLYEITAYYMNLVTLARVSRNPSVKMELQQKNFNLTTSEKIKSDNSVPCGFLCYPISQAADITAFCANKVPVGIDQLPMIEQTNEIVQKFNAIYHTDILKKCEAMLTNTPKLMGIDGKHKASKSLNNCIFLSDTSEIVKQKVMAMYTDPNHIKINDPGKIEDNMVFHYLDIFHDNTEELALLKTEYAKGGLGDIFLKNKLYAILEDFLNPIREKRTTIKNQNLKEILFQGTKKASHIASETLGKMKNAMQLNFF